MVVRGGCSVNAPSFKESGNVLLDSGKRLYSHRSIHGSWRTSRGLLPWESVFDGACKTFTKAGSNQIESNMLGFASQSLQYSCLNGCDGCLCKLSNWSMDSFRSRFWNCSSQWSTGHFIALFAAGRQPGTQQLCCKNAKHTRQEHKSKQV